MIGLPTMILRLSTPAPLTAPGIAPAMSPTVTAPNSRPPSPARTGRSTVVLLELGLDLLGVVEVADLAGAAGAP